MLLSKRAELFLPEKWPAYFSKAKGCHVWDLDGNKFIDMSIMGIGTNTLGYGNDKVDSAVLKAISEGNMSTFNCPEEVYLAEKLVELHPWAEMVRFARTGGEANAIAIRIARAASGKDKIALCGYHGWHDWYLATNLKEKNSLNDHLLPGLDPKGVPKALEGSVIPFKYNKYEELENIVKRNQDLAAIKMEVQRSELPTDGYLFKIRELCDKNNIILIFDECTSGFRETYGGIHLKYDVNPDISIFGKALGNGYAITSIIGKRNIMEYAQNTFISSTFWTERIGPTAGLKTLEEMKKIESWKIISKVGETVSQGWKELANQYNLNIFINGIKPIPSFTIKSEKMIFYKTYITQEMLKKGFLASNLFFASTCHSQEIISKYFEALNSIFKDIKECEEGRDILNLLEGPVCHSGFKRLN